MNEAIDNRCTFTKTKVQENHEKKFQKIDNKKHDNIKKRWVINTSKRTLSKAEITVLRKGMNYAITPRTIPLKEIIASVEQGIKNLTNDDKNSVRELVCNAVNMQNVLHTGICHGRKKKR